MFSVTGFVNSGKEFIKLLASVCSLSSSPTLLQCHGSQTMRGENICTHTPAHPKPIDSGSPACMSVKAPMVGTVTMCAQKHCPAVPASHSLCQRVSSKADPSMGDGRRLCVSLIP